jgi:FkbM family methyltransferase
MHIGAHEAEEMFSYDQHRWHPVIWIEAQPTLAAKLQNRLDPTFHKVINAAVWDLDGIALDLKITSNSQSTSLLNLGTHALDYPEIKVTELVNVRTSRIDSIFELESVPNFVNLDIQGAEFNALQGFGKLIKRVNYIYTEVNKKEVYEGCVTYPELNNFLESEGFLCVSIRWVPNKGWGDALFVRQGKIKLLRSKKALSRFFSLSFYLTYYAYELKAHLKRTLRF